MRFSRAALLKIILVMLTLWGLSGRAGAQFAYDVTRPIAARAFRSSSADPRWPHGNSDSRSLPAKGKLVIADLPGPGVINHLWLTFGDNNPTLHAGALRELTLKFYWDNETSPSVECPVGDFFALGNGQTGHVESMMVQVGGPLNRGLNCYWPMSFLKHARLEIHNRSASQAMSKVFFHVDWIKCQGLPADTLNFHARFREEKVTPGKPYYLVADIKGPGTYVGTVLSVHNPSGFGEADETIFIDGEKNPSISGTGSEDYFGQAWGFKGENSLYHGAMSFPDRTMTMYRWHVLDPIPFSRSLQFHWENFGMVGANYGESTFEFSSVAYWYAASPRGQGR